MRFHFCLFAFFASSTALLASPPTQPPSEELEQNSGLLVYRGGNPGEFMVSWWGYDENFYFIETSDDLEVWTLLPVVELGADEAITLGFDLADARRFWKLDYSDDPESVLLSTDYNGIGVSAWDQLQLDYNPFEWVDTDTNDLHDAWELHHFDLIGVDPDADPDGDGLSHWQEFLAKSDPFNSDTNADGLIDTSHYLAGVAAAERTTSTMLTITSVFE